MMYPLLNPKYYIDAIRGHIPPFKAAEKFPVRSLNNQNRVLGNIIL